MRTDALIFMVITYTVIITVTAYFFYLALTTKPNHDSDSFNKK